MEKKKKKAKVNAGQPLYFPHFQVPPQGTGMSFQNTYLKLFPPQQIAKSDSS